MVTSLAVHIDEEILEAYSLGRIADQEAVGLEEHLLLCPTCQQRLEQTDHFVRAFRVAAHGLAIPDRVPKWAGGRLWNSLMAIFTPAPMAAAVAVAAMVIVALAPRVADQGAAPAEIRLQALRGAAPGSTLAFPAGRPLKLELDGKALGGAAYRVELSDSKGKRVWQSREPVNVGEDSTLRTAVPLAVPAGLYWVRLYEPESGQLAREYGFLTH